MKDKIFLFFTILLCLQPTKSARCLENGSLWLDSDEFLADGIQSYEIIENGPIPPDYAWFRFPTHHPQKVNWTLDVRLYRVDGEPRLVSSEILNITYASSGFFWGVRLPEDAPAIYRFGVIRKDNLDGSEGALITTVYVPVLNLSMKSSIKLVLDKTVYRPNEDITYTTMNLGDYFIPINQGFIIEKKVDDGWVQVKQSGVPLVFVDIMDGIHPHSERNFTIRTSLHYKGLTKGRYRIVRKLTEYNRVEKKSCLIYQLTAEVDIVQIVMRDRLDHYLHYILYSLLAMMAIYTVYSRFFSR